MVWIPEHNFTCGIQRVDKYTLNALTKKVMRAAVEDIRPSTMYHFVRRPKGENWTPPWIPPKQVDVPENMEWQWTETPETTNTTNYEMLQPEDEVWTDPTSPKDINSRNKEAAKSAK